MGIIYQISNFSKYYWGHVIFSISPNAEKTDVKNICHSYATTFAFSLIE